MKYALLYIKKAGLPSPPNDGKMTTLVAVGGPSPSSTPAYTWSGPNLVTLSPTQSQSGSVTVTAVKEGKGQITGTYNSKDSGSASDTVDLKVLKHQILTFSDRPSRSLSVGAVTWRATLQAVSQKTAGNSAYDVLESITYGFDISAAGVVTLVRPTGSSSIIITGFATFNNGASGGLSIQAKIEGCAESSLRWVQTITTSHPLGGCTSPYNDPCPPDDSLPFYWTDSELPSHITDL